MKIDAQKQIKQTLTENNACYVLITCGKPNEDGDMQVEMTYEGDAVVAAYLLQGAQSFMDEQVLKQPRPLVKQKSQTQSQTRRSNSKIHRID